MRNTPKCLAATILGLFVFSCTEPEPVIPEAPEEIPEIPGQKPDYKPEDNLEFIESVPDTVTFTNAEFIYNGDDIGEEINVDTAWHNDDYYFRYEDPVMYYSEYRKLKSGTICIKKASNAKNIFSLKADIILPDGKDFKVELLSTEFEPYSQSVD